MTYTARANAYVSGSTALELMGEKGPANSCVEKCEVLDFNTRTRNDKTCVVKTAVMIALCVVFLGMSVYCLGFGDELRRDASMSAVELEPIVVTEGDTLWSLSEERPVSGLTVSEEVYELKKTNSLTSSEIKVGDVLLVPVYLD